MDGNKCAEEISRALSDLGLQAGDSLLVHSSFKSLGAVPGGIETVVQGMLRAIRPAGTLLMPALSWNLRPPEVFDVRSTRSIVGAVTEHFRTRPGTLRSVHPTHSVCAVGRRARDLLDEHRLDSTPCGPHSPFGRLLQEGGKILMLGCGLHPNTAMHALEEQVQPPYLFGPSLVFTVADSSGSTYQKEYRTHGFDGYRQRYDRVEHLDAGTFLRRGRVLQAEAFLIDAIGLRQAVIRVLREEPLYFVDRITTAREGDGAMPHIEAMSLPGPPLPTHPGPPA